MPAQDNAHTLLGHHRQLPWWLPVPSLLGKMSPVTKHRDRKSASKITALAVALLLVLPLLSAREATLLVAALYHFLFTDFHTQLTQALRSPRANPELPHSTALRKRLRQLGAFQRAAREDTSYTFLDFRTSD